MGGDPVLFHEFHWLIDWRVVAVVAAFAFFAWLGRRPIRTNDDPPQS